jgi:hypothetical protein
VIVWSNGDKFIGEFKNGVYDGAGNLSVDSKSFHYVGQFRNGKAEGEGKLKVLLFN